MLKKMACCLLPCVPLPLTVSSFEERVNIEPKGYCNGKRYHQECCLKKTVNNHVNHSTSHTGQTSQPYMSADPSWRANG